jgi:Protein of unknown function (DUF2911)
MLSKTAFTLAFAVVLCPLSFPQGSINKMPGEPAQAQCKFSDEAAISVDYYHAHIGGRRIFGGVVPYGEVWRTSVTGPITFITADDLVTVKGTTIPAGGYAFLVVPYPDKWTLIINKNTVYESGEIARVPMSVKKLSAPVENFTISFDRTGGSCTLRIVWENTQASLELAERNTDLPLQNPLRKQK